MGCTTLTYVFKYWFCELLSLVNIIGQLFLVDRFLGGEFMKYGIKVLEFSDRDQEERVDPMIFVFPRMTKCHFHIFGPSGTIERRDSLCLLPLNMLNEKTFIFIWFWYVILATLLSFLVLYRLILLAMPGLRPRIMYQHNRAVPIEVFQAFTNKTSIGDWWILYILSKNIDPMVYRDIMTRLAKEVETSASNNAYLGNPVGGGGKEGLHASSAV
ncbi:Innexin inx1 [Armadillidium nasatum]|uniref:Innexin n=1 Tax=Armadillidium nasatum TaxID=96803 RepID=A0A5N5T6H7_9CRUS|nr:Innexin inx1 [Armadillidium nasatum]